MRKLSAARISPCASSSIAAASKQACTKRRSDRELVIGRLGFLMWPMGGVFHLAVGKEIVEGIQCDNAQALLTLRH